MVSRGNEPFFEEPTTVRLSEDIRKKADDLVRAYPEKYESVSHVFRCAVIRLHSTEIDEKGNRRLSVEVLRE